MTQLQAYSKLTDGVTSRYYTGFPLNSTLVSSYTPDTIRSIISQAAARQPYSTAVWIRINSSGIQISAQDTEISRSRIPVFIPINLAHDIFMLPSINNVICIVYDEPQSNMKGILLYVIYPSDAQSLREDFRLAKQGSNIQQQPYSNTFDSRYQNTVEIQPITYVPGKSTLTTDSYRNNKPIQQQPSKRVVYVRENEIYSNRNSAPTFAPTTYVPFKGEYHSEREDYRRRHKSSRRPKTGNSGSKRSSDSGIKPSTKQRSRTPDQKVKSKSPVDTKLELTQEQIQQQQLLILQQQQQMAAWQAAQQTPLIPIGIYNRYVPKSIPLPTGETIKTTFPAGTNSATTNGTAITYIVSQPSDSGSRSNSPQSPQQQNYSIRPQISTPSTTYYQRNTPVINQSNTHINNQSNTPINNQRNTPLNNTNAASRPTSTLNANESQPRSRYNTPSITNNDDETKLYLKLLVEEMHLMKLEMDKIRQSTVGTPKGRSDSIRIDLKEMRSHIEHLRARMGMTPTIPEN